MRRALRTLLRTAALGLLVSGCGSSSPSNSTSSPSAATAPPQGSPASGAGPGGAAALSAEARSAATGDIPDNQVYLRFHDQAAGYTIDFPEGWTRKGDGADVTFADKNNIIHVVVSRGAPASAAAVSAELSRLRRTNSTLSFTSPSQVTLKSGPAIKTTYTTRSAPSSVTGKSVVLVVDRYELGRSGHRATVDLATAKGVDTVDAYRMIINSFNWR